jgi:ribosomal protein L40E
MVYCQRCGKQNDEGAQFCNKCGANLLGPQKDYAKAKRDEECEEECAAEGKSAPAFWGVLVLLIGLLIIVEIVKAIFEDSLPGWFLNLNIWWIIALFVGLAILLAGFRMLTKRT